MEGQALMETTDREKRGDREDRLCHPVLEARKHNQTEIEGQIERTKGKRQR
jgi:hypothetical protein